MFLVPPCVIRTVKIALGLPVRIRGEQAVQLRTEFPLSADQGCFRALPGRLPIIDAGLPDNSKPMSEILRPDGAVSVHQVSELMQERFVDVISVFIETFQ